MKIKIKTSTYSQFENGKVYDAAVAYDRSSAVAFPPGSVASFYFNSEQFEVSTEEQEPVFQPSNIREILSLRLEGHFTAQDLVALKDGGVF